MDRELLEREKYDHAEIPRAALREPGVDFDTLMPQTREAMRMGLPVEALVPVATEVMPGIKVSEVFSPRFYRDHNNELKVALDAPLRYERPYILESIRKQLTEEQQQALCRYESIISNNIKSRNGKSLKGCTLQSTARRTY